MSLSLRIFKLTPQGLGRRKRRIPIEYFIYLRNPCAVFLILSVHPTTFVISWTGCYHLTILSSWPPTHFLNSFRLVSLLFFLHYSNFNLLPSARPFIPFVIHPSFITTDLLSCTTAMLSSSLPPFLSTLLLLFLSSLSLPYLPFSLPSLLIFHSYLLSNIHLCLLSRHLSFIWQIRPSSCLLIFLSPRLS